MTDAADLALQIESMFSSACEMPCTCGVQPEDYCRHCGAWALAIRDTEKMIEKYAEEQSA